MSASGDHLAPAMAIGASSGEFQTQARIGCSAVAGKEKAAASSTCAVCLEPLCEPVQWPGPCGHSFCLLCSLRLRCQAQPTCPLCRAPATRPRREADIKVDKALAQKLRERGGAAGAARYDAQKARIAKEVRRLREELGVQGFAATAELPLLCVGTWDFPQGSRRGLQLNLPREVAVAQFALSGPSRSFGLLLADRIVPGARGRVAKVVGRTALPEGGVVVVVEGGESFSVRRATSEPRSSHGSGRSSPGLRFGLLDLGESSEAAAPRRRSALPRVASSAEGADDLRPVRSASSPALADGSRVQLGRSVPPVSGNAGLRAAPRFSRQQSQRRAAALNGQRSQSEGSLHQRGVHGQPGQDGERVRH